MERTVKDLDRLLNRCFNEIGNCLFPAAETRATRKILYNIPRYFMTD